MNSIELSLTTQHEDNMTRNLSGYDLKVDPIKTDGNCFFRATSRQLQKHLVQGLELLSCQHISSLGLGINEERDTENLRFLFVCEVTEKIDEYNQSGQPATNLQRKLNFLKMMVILLVNLATSVQRPVQICSAAQLFSSQPYQLSLPFCSYQNISSLLYLFTWRMTIQVQGIMTRREVCSDNSHILNTVEQRTHEQVFWIL